MTENPYSNSVYGAAPPIKSTMGTIRKVPINPFDLFQRGYRLIQDQYWLFLGMSLVAMFIGSAVPFGIVMAPMIVGLHMALAQKSRQGTTEFGVLFKGFDKFGEAVIAMLIMLGISLAIMIPVVLLSIFGFAAVAAGTASTGGNEALVGISFVFFLFGIVAVTTFASIACYLPFLFTFQLIADQNLSGWDACKQSFQGVLTNLLGLIVYCLALGLVSILLTLMCYFPVFLFMPISFASMFVLYQDIFGQSGLRQTL